MKKNKNQTISVPKETEETIEILSNASLTKPETDVGFRIYINGKKVSDCEKNVRFNYRLKLYIKDSKVLKINFTHGLKKRCIDENTSDDVKEKLHDFLNLLENKVNLEKQDKEHLNFYLNTLR